MSDQPARVPAAPVAAAAAAAANIVRRNGVYHLYMLVEGRWLETGVTSRKFLEITDVADREFDIVHINAPLDAPPPPPPPAEQPQRPAGASDLPPRAKAS
jgi:hypothetical protein